MSILHFWFRPSFWTGLIAIIAYWDNRALNGKWVYDDAGSVVKNIVVNGMVPWHEAFTRDYWGVEMKEAQSHKSFRPITTLSLKASYLWALRYKSPEEKHPPTYPFHLVNVLLHGVVSTLVTEATYYILPNDAVLPCLVRFLFGLHPVHAEVVSNITSRGELLMSFFMLLAFLSYASTISQQEHDRQQQQQQQQLDSQQNLQSDENSQETTKPPVGPTILQRIQSTFFIYIFPWLGMTLSLFSKEQGATTLISLVLWDFLRHHGNVLAFWKDLQGKKTDSTIQQQQQYNIRSIRAWQFLRRAIVLAIETILVVLWRMHLNGETSPDFIEAQNPAGFAKDRFTRAFSVSWVYCLYIRDAIYPFYLGPDWSGLSIDLIRSLQDPRALLVLCLWYGSAMSAWSVIVGPEQSTTATTAATASIPPSDTAPTTTITTTNDNDEKDSNSEKATKKTKTPSISNTSSSPSFAIPDMTLRQVNMAIWAFCFSPFLLSSNILVVVGLMKADRVIYLPLFGFCLFEAIILGHFCFKGVVAMPLKFSTRRQQEFWAGYVSIMLQLIVFAGRTHQRNIAWSDPLLLWEGAYLVNPKSHHTRYNYGYELSLKQRYLEAEDVMRPIGSARVDGPSNTFVYAMVLFNLNRCGDANRLVDEALDVIEEKRREGGVRNTAGSLDRTKSNLLVARAHCAKDIVERGRIMYEAVQVDPTNEYAVNLAQQVMEKLQHIEQLKQQYSQ